MRSLPAHVAIIMDGNSRWAKDKKIPKKPNKNNTIDIITVIET